ncbi:MAG: glycosyltransferase family 4 protein [Verrucomicrobiota bacterium]|jgi:glycosyltransferase involved in cell wall biosynthesis
MNIVLLSPGAGAMYCGNCLRDNALVGELRRRGHAVLMAPLYLPLTLDEPDASAGTPIFFSGINVFLDQKAALFRSAPQWLRNVFRSPDLLRWTGRFAAKTRPGDIGELTLSMLRGEHGNQAGQLEELIAWLRLQPAPDVICLSNALLAGFARRLRDALNTPVVCLLAGEEAFLDAMDEPMRRRIWRLLAEQAPAVDRFVAPSRYFADRMGARLKLPAGQLTVVPLGLNLEGYRAAPDQPSTCNLQPSTFNLQPPTPTLGYFARMCRDKGLDTLVAAFIELKRRGRVPGLRLKIGGSCGPADEPFVAGLKAQLGAAGFLGDVEFHPNLNRVQKIAFLRSLTVFSVPALYGEAFGLYLLEALAAGVPVVQPRHAAFPEVVAATGGGVLCEPGDVAALAGAIEQLLLDPERRQSLGGAGRRAIHERFGIEQMGEGMLAVLRAVAAAPSRVQASDAGSHA